MNLLPNKALPAMPSMMQLGAWRRKHCVTLPRNRVRVAGFHFLLPALPMPLRAGDTTGGVASTEAARQPHPSEMQMDDQAFFWKIMRNELPPPRAAETLGIVFKNIDAEAGTVEVEFQGKAEFTNPAGNIQGGFLAAMLDDTMGPALSATLRSGEFAPTLNLNVSFQRPASVGTLVGHGRILRRGKDVCFLSAELLQDGQVVATATATAIVRALPR